MDIKYNFVLRHKETGLYLNYMTKHSPDLWPAWRFLSKEQAEVWLRVAEHAPKFPDQYEPVEVEMTIKIKG